MTGMFGDWGSCLICCAAAAVVVGMFDETGMMGLMALDGR